MPGPGASSPIHFGQRIYLTCYTGYGIPKVKGLKNEDLKRHLLCLNRADGAIIWNTLMDSKVIEWYGGFPETHDFASSTPTDPLHAGTVRRALRNGFGQRVLPAWADAIETRKA